MSTLVREQRLFLDDGERFPWPVTRDGKDRDFSVQWVFVTDRPGHPREVMLAGFLVLLNGDVSTDYQRGWINVHTDVIPERVRGEFK